MPSGGNFYIIQYFLFFFCGYFCYHFWYERKSSNTLRWCDIIQISITITLGILISQIEMNECNHIHLIDLFDKNFILLTFCAYLFYNLMVEFEYFFIHSLIEYECHYHNELYMNQNLLWGVDYKMIKKIYLKN